MTILFELFITFFKIGLFTIGGGYAMLPLMQQEVLAHGWMTASEVIDFIAISESTPGPFAINAATYIGSTTNGFWGSVFATLGIITPSFIIILIVARFYSSFKNNKIVKGIMTGLRPAVIGLISSALVSLAATVFFPKGLLLSQFTQYSFWTSLVICAGMSVLAFKKINPILIIVISAALGLIFGYTGDLLNMNIL